MPVSTPFFDSVITYANQVYDSGYKMEAMEMVMSAHANTPGLTMEDDINYYVYCGEIFRKDLKDYNKYIEYADSILMTLEKNNAIAVLPARYIQACEMKADALFAKGFYSASYDYYFKAKKLSEDNHDSCSLSQYSYSLGMVMYKQQRYREAAGHFTEAFGEITRCKDIFAFFYRRQELLDNIGLCYFYAGKYDTAMLYYRKTLDYVDENSHRFDKNESVFISAKAVVYGNMADLFTVLKRYDTAALLLKKSIAINLQKGYTNSDAIIDQVKLGNLLYNTGDIAALKPLLQDITAELDTIPDQQVAISLNKLKWQYYDHEHDNENAYRYLRAYVLMDDSMQVKTRSLMATDVDGMIKGMEKQYQITLLNKNSLEEKIYLVIAAVVVAMAILIIFLVGRNIKGSRQHVARLKALNDEVTRQKEKLQAALTELEWKDKDKSRILRSTAHDVLNPIGAISGLISILSDEPQNFSGEQKEILALVKDSCDNLTSLCRDILEAGTPEDLKSLPKEWVNINKLIHNSVDLFIMRASVKRQQLVFTANEENVEAFVNKEKIWRVINNLVSNAIKFSYENAVIEINMELKDSKVDICVKDHGIGIPDARKPFIFDMFTEAKAPGTAGEVPHGLGLSISLQIARAHNGTIWFDSQQGKGTSFHFVIPVNSAS